MRLCGPHVRQNRINLRSRLRDERGSGALVRYESLFVASAHCYSFSCLSELVATDKGVYVVFTAYAQVTDAQE